MGKGRAPCCDKTKVKKGPWTPAEDLTLIAFIHRNGHENWRSLPKLAGLARCGKSCRLRWINYLRPDVKRGNFTHEEEETIMKLHESMGNKWSVIASYFPGRTDNEIKNVWNTHLKKKVKHLRECKDVSSSSSLSSCCGKRKTDKVVEEEQNEEKKRIIKTLALDKTRASEDDYEYLDLWSMLDMENLDCYDVVDEAEQRKWVKQLESELGLEVSSSLWPLS